MRRIFGWSFVLAAALATFALVRAETASSASPDLGKQPTLYVVGYSHLDTQWRWDYVKTIAEYIPNTMRDNFALFEKYPNYVLNFSGSNRYRMMKEYYPTDYQKVRSYVAAGRWFPAGSSVEESDVNVISAESLIRQILYGSTFFRREFGKTSAEFMLPDCFGFPASLPSILAHAGIKGFSTQKLTWGSAAPVGGPSSPQNTPVGIPFNVGLWQGPDGRSVIAALNAGRYTGPVAHDLSKSPSPDLVAENAQLPVKDLVVDWPARVEGNGQASGLFTDYHYYGIGDRGGAPAEVSVKLLEAIVTRGQSALPSLEAMARRREAGEVIPLPTGPAVQMGDGPLKVVAATAEQMFLDITPEQTTRLPRYQGDLQLTEHSAGTLSSQAAMKRWNRQNEVLADDAERASVTAEWLGARAYPRERLTDAWTLVMAGQFHDILPGTSIPKAYEYSWNDQVLAANQFIGVLTSASEAITAGLDTRVQGIPVVVYNPLAVDREDVVEAIVPFPGAPPMAVRVSGPDGREVPAQLGQGGTVVFLARVPSVGWAVYDVRAADAPAASTLKVSESSLENTRYRVQVDGNGDVSGIFDKALGKQMLSAPARLAFQTARPQKHPAWNMDWNDQKQPPRGYVGGPAKIRVVESGPARVALRIERETEGSRFVQTIRLAAGDAGARVEFANAIDWHTREAALKATFPLTASNPWATYNWDVGTIRRGNNDEKKFEVASHQWFDLTDRSGHDGLTVLSDSKFGSDKPDDSTLRLTLIYTPGAGGEQAKRYWDQPTQDIGYHEFVYGVASHAGDHRKERTDVQAFRLNQPLVAFNSPAHPGALGKTFSFLRVSSPSVRVLALKKAEQSDEVVVRLVELDGQAAPGVRVTFAAPVVAGRELDGREDPIGPARLNNGSLVADLGAFGVRSYAVKLARPETRLGQPRSTPVPLPYDRAVTSADGARAGAGFDAAGRSLPAELLPARIAFAGIHFDLASAAGGQPNAVTARGQTIALPAGKFSRLHLLAAAADGDHKAQFRIGDRPVELTIQHWGGYVGQWHNRTWKSAKPIVLRPPESSTPRPAFEYTGLVPGFVKPAPIAWFASHRHDAAGANDIYAYAYLFAYAIDVPPDATTLTLPDNDRIRVLAVTVSDEVSTVRPAQPLFDTFVRTAQLRPGPLPATLVRLLGTARSGAGCLDLPRACRWTCPRETADHSPSRLFNRVAADGS